MNYSLIYMRKCPNIWFILLQSLDQTDMATSVTSETTVTQRSSLTEFIEKREVDRNNVRETMKDTAGITKDRHS